MGSTLYTRVWGLFDPSITSKTARSKSGFQAAKRGLRSPVFTTSTTPVDLMNVEAQARIFLTIAGGRSRSDVLFGVAPSCACNITSLCIYFVSFRSFGFHAQALDVAHASIMPFEDSAQRHSGDELSPCFEAMCGEAPGSSPRFAVSWTGSWGRSVFENAGPISSKTVRVRSLMRGGGDERDLLRRFDAEFRWF